MARNKSFNPNREPLRRIPDLQLKKSRIGGPFSFLNPTQAYYDHVAGAKSSAESRTSREDGEEQAEASRTAQQDTPASNIGFKWTSRNNRKGRHALLVQPTDAAQAKYATPPPTYSFEEVLKNVWKMFSYYPVWDVSYLVAVVFTWGSIIWVINVRK